MRLLWQFVLILGSGLFFSACWLDPKVVRTGEVKRYELGGAEPCVDEIVSSRKEINALLDDAGYPTYLSKAIQLRNCKACESVCEEADLCRKIAKLREERSACIAQERSSLLVNPFVILR